jgi:uncharacterized secreted protein with C-terminal beta-propeller domain
VTSYPVPQAQIEASDPATFVPLRLHDGARAPLAARTINTLTPSDTYAVVTAADVASGEALGEQAVLGGADTVYMSAENLSVASMDYSGTTQPLDGLIRVNSNDWAPVTHLARIALANGELTATAKTILSGTLLNQFALDEYEGNLRVTMSIQGFRAVESDAEGILGRIIGQTDSTWQSWTALHVLDADLKILGSVGDLAVGETVQSVRYMGTVGYVVTFKQVDPLFAIDLADPSAPRVMSALKIPGFSTYMHPWGDGRLLGFGIDTNDDGQQQGLKLSLFDTSDPYDVREVATTKVPFDYSPALDNHKAVWVDVERGLIGFPVTSWSGDAGDGRPRFAVYAWDGSAFAEIGTVEVAGFGSSWYAEIQARAARIDDYLYIASPAAVQAVRLDNLDEAASLVINEVAIDEWGGLIAE